MQIGEVDGKGIALWMSTTPFFFFMNSKCIIHWSTNNKISIVFLSGSCFTDSFIECILAYKQWNGNGKLRFVQMNDPFIESRLPRILIHHFDGPRGLRYIQGYDYFYSGFLSSSYSANQSAVSFTKLSLSFAKHCLLVHRVPGKKSFYYRRP